jgi:hypothetical protein
MEMDKNTLEPTSKNITRSSFMPRLAIIGASAFIVLLGLLHLLEPQFTPSWRVISEYELGNYGWIMRLAFFLFALGSISLAVTLLRTHMRSVRGYIGLGLMLMIAVGVTLGGLFTADPITATTHTSHGTLHQLGGGLSFPVMPIAALIVSLNLIRHNALWKSARKPVISIMALIWISIVVFIVIGFSTAHGRSAGSPDIIIGWPNRAAVVFYNLWVIVVAWHALKLRGTTTQR